MNKLTKNQQIYHTRKILNFQKRLGFNFPITIIFRGEKFFRKRKLEGFFHRETNSIYCTKKYSDSRRIASILTHELGHAIDWFIGNTKYSQKKHSSLIKDTPFFKRALNTKSRKDVRRLCKQLCKYSSRNLKYWLSHPEIIARLFESMEYKTDALNKILSNIYASS